MHKQCVIAELKRGYLSTPGGPWSRANQTVCFHWRQLVAAGGRRMNLLRCYFALFDPAADICAIPPVAEQGPPSPVSDQT